MKNADKRQFHLLECFVIFFGAIFLFVYTTLMHFLYLTWVDYFKSLKYTILGLISGVKGNTKDLLDEIDRREK